jgi:hypothetical protein
MNDGLKLPVSTVHCSLFTLHYISSFLRATHTISLKKHTITLSLPFNQKKDFETRSTQYTALKKPNKRERIEMSVLNVNMPERDLDPEEIDLEQEEEDAFGECPSRNR